MAFPKLQSRVEPFPARCSGLKGLSGEIQWLAVMRLQNEEAQGHRTDTAV